MRTFISLLYYFKNNFFLKTRLKFYKICASGFLIKAETFRVKLQIKSAHKLRNNDLLYSCSVLNTVLNLGFHKRAYKLVKGKHEYNDIRKAL